jgi:hypothetical protein
MAHDMQNYDQLVTLAITPDVIACFIDAIHAAV